MSVTSDLSGRKIVIYIPSFDGGGAERVFVRLANHFAGMGLGTTLVVNSERGPLRTMLKPAVELVNLGVTRRGGALTKLAGFLRHRKPRVLVSAMTPVNVTAILARALSMAPTAIITSERNQVSGLMRHWSGSRRTIFTWMLRLLYPHARHMTAVTAGVAADLAKLAHLKRSRITVIDNPAPDEDDIAAARQSASPHAWFDENEPVLVAVGRLTPQKGYPVLLEALKLAREQRPVRLLVLGDGPQRAELVALADRLGVSSAVDFLGFTDNRLDYLVRASVYVLSSDTEGFPNSLLEAVSCDVRVVSTDCAGGGARTILGQNASVIVPVGDATSLARVILGELDRPAKPGEIAALAQPFSMQSTANRFLGLIESCW